jgi:hypothetical protein
MEFLKEDKRTKDTRDQILSGVTTLIQSSPAVNGRGGAASDFGKHKAMAVRWLI